MPTTPTRGLPYPTLASANDPPRDFQMLAEAVDAQLETLDQDTIKLVARTLAPDFTVGGITNAQVALPDLTTDFASVAGHLYRISLNIASRSSAVADVVQFYVRVDGADVGEFPKAANSGRDNPGTSNYQVVQAFWTAPADGARQVTIRAIRAAGTGTITAASTALQRAAVVVEDMGAA